MNTIPKRGPGRPKNHENTNKRIEEILDAATAQFAQDGYQSTDVQDIADYLNVAKGTIYHYFPSK
ncbi:MAG: TetR/AcrR family transcriptional regulator, partial [Candidatus Obscuribacterales bacterium]|nr:TetR/AcrR family transcriptional regulator [Candidatus Obscuribacterales bacterium]